MGSGSGQGIYSSKLVPGRRHQALGRGASHCSFPRDQNILALGGVESEVVVSYPCVQTVVVGLKFSKVSSRYDRLG